MIFSDNEHIRAYTLYRDFIYLMVKSFRFPTLEEYTRYIGGGRVTTMIPSAKILRREDFIEQAWCTNPLPQLLANRIAGKFERRIDLQLWDNNNPYLIEFYKCFLDYQQNNLSIAHLQVATRFLDCNIKEGKMNFLAFRPRRTKLGRMKSIPGHALSDVLRLQSHEKTTNGLDTLCGILKNPNIAYEVLYAYQETQVPELSEALRWNPAYPDEWKVVLSLRFFDSPILG